MIEYDRKITGFLGLPHQFSENIKIYSPTINQISSIGYMNYMINLHLTLFDKQRILVDLFNLDQEVWTKIQDESDYDVLVESEAVRKHICNALSFFVRDEVDFDQTKSIFCVSGHEFISRKTIHRLFR